MKSVASSPLEEVARVQRYLAKLAAPESLSPQERLAVDRGIIARRAGFDRCMNPYAEGSGLDRIWAAAYACS